ncbi:uncharacterized protein K02A2.6-like [Ornithodoros turicata]|uniref:uncharacterized protein K02A2.6-like n=1 Tax=Ornithodoros turicata TaxID=34597 RepID=UPI003138660A
MQQDLDLTNLLKQARLLEDVDKSATIMEQQKETVQANFRRQKGRKQRQQQPQALFKSPPQHSPPTQQTEGANTRDPNSRCRHCGGKWPHQGVKDSDSDENVFAVATVSSTSKQNTPQVALTVNGTTLMFTIDTGASVSVISRDTFCQLRGKPEIKKSNTRVYAFGSQQPLPIIGKICAALSYKDKTSTEDIFIIEKSVSSILSFTAATNLDLIKVAYTVDKSQSPLVQFPSICSVVGKLKNFQVHLQIDKEVAPVAQPYRRVPFALRKKVEAELDRLLALDIIEVAEGATPWVSPIVIVPKPRNPEEIRLCLDMRCANKAIVRERHVCPTVDDIITTLNGATTFTKLDLRNGYHQLELDPESRVITTFATHVGLFRYKRLMFGINTAAEIFQDAIRQTLSGIPSAINLSDDILVFGKTQAEHDIALHNTLGRLHVTGVTINVSKCSFSQPELRFFGYPFSAAGISPDPSKVEAFCQLQPPTDVHELRSLLGTINFCGRFIPNLTDLTHPLRSSLDIIDASPRGLGAILSQDKNGKREIVAYASKTLTPVETRYTQIERELLAAVWDHKPLVFILKNRRASPSARLERLALKLTQYSFTVEHTRGISIPSDYLSRHTLQVVTPATPKHHPFNEYVNFLTQLCVPRNMTLEEIVQETSQDVPLQQVIKALDNPSTWSEKAVQDFTSVRHQLSVSDLGLILKEHQLVLPTSLQQRVITLAHQGHEGITKTLKLLRSKVWFPRMEDQVKRKLKNCLPCQATVVRHQKDPIEVPSKPVVPCLFGLPKKIHTDNGPPFQSYEFRTFLQDHGIKHHRVTPYWPQANGEVERFMRTLKRFVQATVIEGKEWTKQLGIFLSAYRATPHETTGRSPYALLFGREMNFALLSYLATEPAHEEHHFIDLQRRIIRKKYADNKRNTSPHTLSVGDTVLCKREQTNKTSSAYDPLPYQVTSVQGTQVTAKRQGSTIKRNASFFKLVPNHIIRTQQPEAHDDFLTWMANAPGTDFSLPSHT